MMRHGAQTCSNFLHSNSFGAWFSFTKSILILPLSLVCIRNSGNTGHFTLKKHFRFCLWQGLWLWNVQVQAGKSDSSHLPCFISQTIISPWLFLSYPRKDGCFRCSAMKGACHSSQKLQSEAEQIALCCHENLSWDAIFSFCFDGLFKGSGKNICIMKQTWRLRNVYIKYRYFILFQLHSTVF